MKKYTLNKKIVVSASDANRRRRGPGPLGALMLLSGLLSLSRPNEAQSFGPASSAAVPLFSDIASVQVADAAGSAAAVAWVDFDSDGDVDLYVANDGSANKLFRNDGSGAFAPISCGAAGDAGPANGVAWADYDNDGDPDLFLAIANGTSKLIRNDGGGLFVDVTSASGLGSLGSNYGVCAWGDYDNDGRVDLCIGKIQSGGGGGFALLLHNLGAGFAQVALNQVNGAGIIGGLAWADYDRDGRLDLFIGRESQRSVLLHNRGGGVFDAYDGGAFAGDGGTSTGVWGDCDGDGDPDLYLVRSTNGGNPRSDNALLRNDGALPSGSPIFTDITGTGALAGVDVSIAAHWGDFDRDGRLDLLLLGASSLSLLQNNGGGSFAGVTNAPLSGALNNSGAWADFDSDGDLDLFVGRDMAANKLLRNGLVTSNRWLRVSLRGTISNRSAIGARVRVTAGGLSWERQVSGSDNGVSQGDFGIAFGLGSAAAIDSVTIYWPSGIVQAVLPAPPINSGIAITETGGAFIDATVSVLAGIANTEGAAWADFDGDGDLDLYAARWLGFGQTNQLWRNDGAGSFAAVTAPGLAGGGAGTGVAWGDYDNDGDPDLFVASSGQSNHLFRNNGVSLVESTLEFGPAVSSAGAAWADYDNDGDLDLYVANLSHANQLFRNDGAESFTNIAAGPLADPGVGIAAAWGDYDGDGDEDLYLSNSNSSNRLLRNNGGGHFEDMTTGTLAGLGDGRGAAWADWDRDGDLDLAVADGGFLGVRLLRNDSGAFTDATNGPLLAVGNASSVGWSDFDNDGDEDLYVVTLQGSPNKLFSNDGFGHFVDSTNGPLGAIADGVGGVWGDFDSDGRQDLFIANYGSSSKLLRNGIGNGNHWLKIRLKGIASNASGIGARVRVVTGGVRQTFEVSGASGYMSQSAMPLHIGLGASTHVDSVIIRWPSRLPQVITNIGTVDRVIQIQEDTAPLAVGPGSNGSGLRLSVGVPNPFRGSTRIGFDLPEARDVRLTIFDLQGRQVRSLLDAPLAPGQHAATWNGADGQGALVPAGIYFVRLESRHGGRTEGRSQKAIVLK